jgi:hypothetical protein
MATNYPTHIDDTSSLPVVADNVHRVDSDVINRLRAAIIAVESELGTKPSGIYGTVTNRLDGFETLINSIISAGVASSFTAAGDLSGNSTSQVVIGLRGVSVSSTAPTNGQILSYDGYSWKAKGPQTPVVTQEAWFIDPVSGNDSNSGLTSGTALKTLAEMYSRWGPAPKLLASVSGFITVTLMSAPGINDPIILSGDLGPDTNLMYKGAASTVRSGTFSAVTALNSATNQAWEVDDSARDWTTDLNKRIKNTTAGANLGQVAWVAKSIGGTSARISQPAFIDAATIHGYTGPTVGVFSTSDTYIVEDITEAYLASVIRVGRFEGNELVHPGRVFFQDIYFKNSVGGTLIQQCASLVFLGCRFDNSYLEHALAPAFMNCNLGNGIGIFESEMSTITGMIAGDMNIASGSKVYMQNWLVQGATIYLFGGDVVLTGTLGIFDSAADAINVGYASYGKGSLDAGLALFGSGNAGHGVNIGPLGSLAYATTPTITGTAGNVVIDGTSLTWRTAPQIFSGTNNSTSTFSVGPNPALTGDCLRLGPSIANAGVYNNVITTRINGADATVVRIHDGASYIMLGDTGYYMTLQGYNNVFASNALGIHEFIIGAADAMQLNANGVQIGPGAFDLGGGTGVIGIDDAAVVPTTNPTGGVVLYSETGALKFRNPAGTITTLGSGGSPGGSDTYIQFNDTSTFGGDAGLTYNKTTNVLSLTDAIAIGAIPASAGSLRLATSSIINYRNASNTGDVQALNCDGSFVYVGDVSRNDSGLLLYSGGSVAINATGDVVLGYGTPRLTATTTNILSTFPLIGDSANTSPYGVHGGVIVTPAIDAAVTLVAAEYNFDWIQVDTGAWATGPFGVIFPTPATKAAGFYKTVFNNSTQTITVQNGGVATRTLTTGLGQRFWFDDGGAFFAGATFTP